MSDDVLGGIHRPHDIDIINEMPFLGLLIFKRVQPAADAGVVDQDVNRIEFFQGQIDQRLDFFFRCNVGFADNDVSSHPFDFVLNLPKPGFADIGKDKVGPFTGEKHCGGATDSIGCSGDDRIFTIESACHFELPVFLRRA